MQNVYCSNIKLLFYVLPWIKAGTRSPTNSVLTVWPPISHRDYNAPFTSNPTAAQEKRKDNKYIEFNLWLLNIDFNFTGLIAYTYWTGYFHKASSLEVTCLVYYWSKTWFKLLRRDANTTLVRRKLSRLTCGSHSRYWRGPSPPASEWPHWTSSSWRQQPGQCSPSWAVRPCRPAGIFSPVFSSCTLRLPGDFLIFFVPI